MSAPIADYLKKRMGDTWQDIQDLKRKHASLKEKLARRKKERQEVVAGILGGDDKHGSPLVTSTSSSELSGAVSSETSCGPSHLTIKQEVGEQQQPLCSTFKIENQPIIPKTENVKKEILPPEKIAEIEKQILLTLDDATLEVPCGIDALIKHLNYPFIELVPQSAIKDLLEKLEAQALIVITKKKESGEITLESVDHSKVSAVVESYHHVKEQLNRKRKKEEKDEAGDHIEKAIAKHPKREDLQKKDDLIESLLSTATAKERENQKVNEEILELLSKPTAKDKSLAEKFKSQNGVAAVQEFCPYGTKEECHKAGNSALCDKLHFKKIIHKHTDENLGDCSFLNTCFHMDTCKYVHYEVDYPENQKKTETATVEKGMIKSFGAGEGITLTPPQWVQCDMRYFDFNVLGKFSVVMADPPWDIHMELPYGTMSDDEMRNLPVPTMQDEGYIFLWVTGRAMELGRECLKLWGYERVDELIWVKTNQLQRIIRTGRTGHWLNHGKEHCLIGEKGTPKNINRGLDCDVIVAEVRATSHKPDEVYGMIERLSPGTRKLELFGRPHNVQPNWVTLGNQVDGVKLLDASVVRAFKEKYPDPKMAMLAPDKAKKFYETGIID